MIQSPRDSKTEKKKVIKIHKAEDAITGISWSINGNIRRQASQRTLRLARQVSITLGRGKNSLGKWRVDLFRVPTSSQRGCGHRARHCGRSLWWWGYFANKVIFKHSSYFFFSFPNAYKPNAHSSGSQEKYADMFLKIKNLGKVNLYDDSSHWMAPLLLAQLLTGQAEGCPPHQNCWHYTIQGVF